MPQRELIDLGGEKRFGLNIGHVVGIGGTNRIFDVMVVQAMFQYIHKGLGENVVPLGKISKMLGDFPIMITGILEPMTIITINFFQHDNAGMLLAHDGRIHPASYRGRKMGLANKKLMTITLLHFYCYHAAKQLGDSDYINGILKRIPTASAAVATSFLPPGKHYVDI